MARKRQTTGLPGRARTFTAKEETVVVPTPPAITSDFYIDDISSSDFYIDDVESIDFYIDNIISKDFQI